MFTDVSKEWIGVLNVGDVCYYETAVNIYQIPQRHVPEVRNTYLGAGLEAIVDTPQNTAIISVIIYTQIPPTGGGDVAVVSE
jgi:hypothetical protein